mmetsp:Transcript_112953/g.269186  ORF Transcript_112953/g.269186 Transcript_112953/m.269186 type:complete len:230 (-) Transcript_112953:712-1401(-)
MQEVRSFSEAARCQSGPRTSRHSGESQLLSSRRCFSWCSTSAWSAPSRRQPGVACCTPAKMLTARRSTLPVGARGRGPRTTKSPWSGGRRRRSSGTASEFSRHTKAALLWMQASVTPGTSRRLSVTCLVSTHRPPTFARSSARPQWKYSSPRRCSTSRLRYHLLPRSSRKFSAVALGSRYPGLTMGPDKSSSPDSPSSAPRRRRTPLTARKPGRSPVLEVLADQVVQFA